MPLRQVPIVSDFPANVPLVTFHPNMNSRISGVTVLEELRCRAWPGVIADVWNVSCTEGAEGHYVSRAPRLFMMLEGDADLRLNLRSADSGPEHALSPERPLCFIPAEMPIWSRISPGGTMRHLDLHLDMASLSERLAGRLDRVSLNEALQAPQFSLTDPRLLQVARLIGRETADPDGLDDLYGESLVTALVTLLARPRPAARAQRGKLPARHLRKVMDHISENVARSISLKELADLVGLSPSYFSEAFKQSTGLPPHRWQMARRVQEAKRLLRDQRLSPTEAALAAGFADQAHFTRVFRRFEGTTPGAWLRSLDG